jgi:hypothetical protein
MGSRGLAAGSAALVVAFLAACGSESSGSSELTLDEWREQACAIEQELEETGSSGPSLEDQVAMPFETMARGAETMTRGAAELEAIGLPTERRAEAEEFVGLIADLAQRLEESAPRLEAASRRLERLMKSIDADKLPPAPEDATVAGGIMTQLMSVPEFKAAWDELMRESADVASSVDEQQLDRLAKDLGLSCLGEEQPRPAGVEPAPCRSTRANPITEADLRGAMAAQGMQLYRDDRCYGDAVVSLSNLSAVVPPEEEARILASEGHVLCELLPKSVGSHLQRYVWRNDPNPVHVRVLNVNCAIYSESKKHVDLLEAALRDLTGVSAAPAALPSSDAIRD